MRPEAEYQEALRWISWGLNDCEISRMTGIPRGTVRDWRHAIDQGFASRRWISEGHRTRPRNDCPLCGIGEMRPSEYTYLLGLYLGDGHIAKARREVYVLRIVQDERYTNLIETCGTAMRALREPGVMHTSFVKLPGCVVVQASWKHWPCLFPQHGPGKKHHRKIELTDWQRDLVNRHPDQLLRGLIHSDGWRGVNRVQKRHYAYPRYQFSNRSDDIRRIFTDACDLVGVRWRRMNRWTISVARRRDVAILDGFVEPKS